MEKIVNIFTAEVEKKLMVYFLLQAEISRGF